MRLDDDNLFHRLYIILVLASTFLLWAGMLYFPWNGISLTESLVVAMGLHTNKWVYDTFDFS